MNTRPAAVENMDTYLVFNTAIRSQIPLPESLLSAVREPTITVTRAVFDAQDQAGYTVRHDWRREGGPVICTSARRGAQYRLSFPGRASFHIQPGDASGAPVGIDRASIDGIACSAEPGCSEDSVRQLLLSQVIPRCLAHCGALLLHASAVTLPTGKTVAFLGESGQGKSTLASYCQQHCARLIDDDCVLLHVEGRQASIVGGAPAIRLFPDSLHALGLGDAGLRRSGSGVATPLDASGQDFAPRDYAPRDYAPRNKQQLSLAIDSSRPQQPVALDALLLLDHPAQTPGAQDVCIRPATGQAAMMALLRGAFQLDPTDSATVTRVFSQAAAVLSGSAALPLHHLCYPRQHDRLSDVLRALLDFLPE